MEDRAGRSHNAVGVGRSRYGCTVVTSWKMMLRATSVRQCGRIFGSGVSVIGGKRFEHGNERYVRSVRADAGKRRDEKRMGARACLLSAPLAGTGCAHRA